MGLVFLNANSNAGLSKTSKVVHERETLLRPDPQRESSTSSPSSSEPGGSTGSLTASQDGYAVRSAEVSLVPQKKPRSPPGSPTKYDFLEMDVSKAFTQQYVSHWVTLCQVGGLSWMTKLPSIVHTTGSSAVEKSILAASLAYHATQMSQSALSPTSTSLATDSKTIMMEAYKWYGFGLSKQRNQLEVLRTGKEKMPSLEDICMPIMLTFFEVICGSNAAGYLHHVMGSARMLELRGPEACAGMELHMMFQTVRAQLGSDSLLFHLLPLSFFLK